MKITSLIFAAALLLPGITFAVDNSNVQEPEAQTPALQDTITDEPESNDSDTPPAGKADVTPTITPDAAAGEAPIAEDEDKWHEEKPVRLQGLNKVTAKTSELKTEVGQKTKFGNLEITVEKCLRRPANEKSESTALLTITDGMPNQERKTVFHGWMFSSSPAISALEHPIYDVILLECGTPPVVVAPPAPVTPVKKTKKAQ